MTTPSTHLSGHVHGEEAVELVARAICAASSDLPWDERTDAQRDMLDTEARAALDALDAAGLLATGQEEFAIRWSESVPFVASITTISTDRARVEHALSETSHHGTVVSRGVTARREQA